MPTKKKPDTKGAITRSVKAPKIPTEYCISLATLLCPCCRLPMNNHDNGVWVAMCGNRSCDNYMARYRLPTVEVERIEN